jgi:FkbM family methyltransferase
VNGRRRRDGAGPPARHRRVLDGLRLRLHRVLSRNLLLEQPGLPPLRLRADSIWEYNRATHAFGAEPGTVQWLRESVRPGDVLYDIGANIGIFALLAAAWVGEEGRVYAFEPHSGTLPALLHNVLINHREDRVEVVAFPLHDRGVLLPFHYRSIDAGSGLSQLAAVEDPFGLVEAPRISELKAAVALDDAIESGAVRAPTLVKLDVDGNELSVLRGMRRLLSGADRPRALQIEVNPRGSEALLAYLDDLGYSEAARHLTRGGERMARAGHDLSTLHYNGIFMPRMSR